MLFFKSIDINKYVSTRILHDLNYSISLQNSSSIYQLLFGVSCEHTLFAMSYIKNIWSRLSSTEGQDLFKHNIAFFKLVGFSVWHKSLSYNIYRSINMLSIICLWIFIGWDIWNNLNTIPLLSENCSTSSVHLMGTIRFISFVRS